MFLWLLLTFLRTLYGFNEYANGFCSSFRSLITFMTTCLTTLFFIGNIEMMVLW